MTHWLAYFPELMGSDAVMYIDGRRSITTAAIEVIETVAQKRKALTKFQGVTHFKLGKCALRDIDHARTFNVTAFGILKQ